MTVMDKGAPWLVQRVFCPGRWYAQSEGETISDLESSSEVFKWGQGDLIQVLLLQIAKILTSDIKEKEDFYCLS